MTRKYGSLIRTIFQYPISGNIHWRQLESLLHHLGATVEPLPGARYRVLLNNVEGILHHPHHSNVFSKQDIKHLRQYLAAAQVTPSLYEESQKNRAEPE